MAKATEKAREAFPNPIVEYYKQITSNQVCVSKKVRIVYKKLVDEINHPRGNWIFDMKKAMRPITFIEKFCRHSKGKAWAGKPVILELWEKALVAAAFGFVHKDTGIRRYTEVDLFVARKNGKSTLAAAIGLYMLVADGEPGSEVYSAATKRDQAKIIWSEAQKMIKQSEALRKRIRITISELAYDKTFSTFKPLSSESDTQDGLNPHGGFIDELHAIKDKNIVDVVVDGMSAREQPMLFITSTMGTLRENIFDEKYEYAENVIYDKFSDERLLAVIYELDDREEWKDEGCWQKANPALGTIKNRITLQDKVEKAKNNPLQLKNLLCKDFNIRETVTGSWLTFEEANNEAEFEMEEIKGLYGVGGNDLAATTDLAWAGIFVMKPGDQDTLYFFGMAFMPKDTIYSRSKEDHVPYDQWAEQGYITLCPGNKIDYRYITDWYLKIKEEYDIIAFWNGYDSWNSPSWVEDMENRMGYENKKNLLPVIMGAKTLSPPMKELKADLAKKKINYNNNPVIKWALTNVVVEPDKNENIRPIKGKNQRQRIDPAVGMIIAYTVLSNNWEDYCALN
jgi:phage terminase large subunit-like protein